MNSQCSRKWRTLTAYSNQLFSIYIHDRKRGNGFSIQHHAFRLFIKLKRLLTSVMGDWRKFNGSSSQEMLPCTISWSLSHICQGLQNMSQHSSVPKPTQALAPSPSLQFLNLLPWSHPRFCGHLSWLRLCSLNDLYSYYLSVQHSCRANEALYHSVPRHPFPLRYQHYPDFTLFYSKPELHGWTLQLLFLM